MACTVDAMSEPPRQTSGSPGSDQEAARREKLRRIRDMGIDPWGGRFDNHAPIRDVRARGDEVQFARADGTHVALPEPLDAGRFRQWLSEQGPGALEGPHVRAAGRIVLKRDAGKLLFLDIRDWTGQIQVLIGRQQVAEDWALTACLDLGDIIGVDGTLQRTRTGELTVFASKLHFLTKALETPPEKYHGLSDPELRQRMRYLDLTYGEGVLSRFLQRTAVVRSMRQSLRDCGFVEVEGPTLHALAGGAAARPFRTHHNALDIDLFLRIALELHLKRLLVGGVERVFEIGRVYRNEGISPRHNPEFTMLEAYQAYGNYETMMDLTEKIVADAVTTVHNGPAAPYGEGEIDFSVPFDRQTYDALFSEHTRVDANDHESTARLARDLDLETDGKHPDVIKNEVFEQRVEPALKGPVFVLDYPASICPLTKRRADNAEAAERFELFIEGMEIANAYTELNDPDLQETLFRTQLAGLAAEDSMARMDDDFLRALRHGMPPAGGLGVGIDRLVMLLTNSPSIRDVILFPLLRPEA